MDQGKGGSTSKGGKDQARLSTSNAKMMGSNEDNEERKDRFG